MNRRLTIAAVLALFVFGAAACGDDDTPVATPGTDTTTTEPSVDPGNGDNGDEYPVDQARDDARAILGMNEEDLDETVRVSRRGDETFMLTQDYVLGRLTVELDDDGSGYRVMSVTVELPDGPETFDLEPS